jgi:uncharacterized cupin superfamily protein
MQKTTLLQRRAAMPAEPLDRCHGGAGAIDWVGVLGGDDLRGRRLRFFHDDVLPPGSSIGVHRHDEGEEYYYVIEGRGTMTLDGERIEIGPGDITAVFAGGEHGLENDSDADLRIIVVCGA